MIALQYIQITGTLNFYKSIAFFLFLEIFGSHYSPLLHAPESLKAPGSQ